MFSIIRRIINWCGKRKHRIYWGFFFCFLESIFLVLPIMGAGFILGVMIDAPRTGQEVEPVWAAYALMGMIVAIAARAFFSYLRASTQESVAFELTEEERIKIGDILMRVSLGFFQKNRTGDLSAAVSTDLSYVELYSMHMIAIVVNAYILSAVMLIMLALFSPLIAAVVLAALLLSLAALTLLGKWSKKSAPTHRKTQDDMVFATLEYLRGIQIVKAYGKAGASSKAIHKAFRDNRKINIGIELKYAPLNGLHLLALDVGSVAIVGASAYLTAQGEMPLNIFLMMALFAFSMFGQVARVNDSVHTLENIDVIMDKLDIISNAKQIDANDNDVMLSNFNIDFKNVDFSYDNTAHSQDYYGGKAWDYETSFGTKADNKPTATQPSHNALDHNAPGHNALGHNAPDHNAPDHNAPDHNAPDHNAQTRLALSDVSFSLPQGSSTAIVGPSGSGKSTICNLLMRFYDVDGGSICIGGVSVGTMKCDSLLRSIATVFQKVYLFNDSILNNIRFGKPDATFEEVVKAAKLAQCHDFIWALPDGYNTVIGDAGGRLSGGEKQRISIARALLKDAPIVILDEATASIDPENEHLISAALAELTRDKTVIAIAHRLHTIEAADQILVLDAGQLVQQGTHEELLQQAGIYQRFVNIRKRAENWVM